MARFENDIDLFWPWQAETSHFKQGNQIAAAGNARSQRVQAQIISKRQ